VQPDLQPMKLFTNRKCNRLSKKCHSERRLAHSLPNALEASAASRNRLFPFSHSLRE
jgi:hypothetical protein